jgi:small-conductance mechanosensitive channel
MQFIKKVLGIVWIILAILTAYFCIVQFGFPKLQTGHQEDLVFGIIIVFVLTPIVSIGLGVFGYFALKGEFDDSKM